MANPAAINPEAISYQIISALKAEQTGENRYLGLCPAHGDKHPSLVIYINADGYIGFKCTSRHCPQADINAAIKEQFGITVPTRSSKGSVSGKVNAKVQYPSHEQVFPFRLRKEGDIIYEYYTATGEIAFFVQRYTEKGKKQIIPYFSKTYTNDEGSTERSLEAKDPPLSGRPIWNLHLLNRYEDRPVLIVEGEKTALAAQKIPALKDYIITTWSGGSSNVRCSDWSVLRNRQSDIFLWPDYDRPGLKAMQEVASRITTSSEAEGDHRLYMLNFANAIENRIDAGWDLADGTDNQRNSYSLEDMLAWFEPVTARETYGNEVEALELCDKQYRKLSMGGQMAILDMFKPDPNSIFGFHFIKSANISAYDIRKVEIGDKGKQVPIIDLWYNNGGVDNMLHGITFNPGINEKEYVLNGMRVLNTFTGFPEFKGDGSDKRLADAWLEHMSKLIPDETTRNWAIDYFAHIFQKPGKKPGTALVFKGGQGVGKTMAVQIINLLLGHRLSAMISKELTKNNAGWTSALLLYQDEWSINHYKEEAYYNSLKALITDSRVRIEEKYVPVFETNSYHRLVFTTNVNNPISLPANDRRFTIADCSTHWVQDADHFRNLMALAEEETALAGFLAYLRARPVVSDLTRGIANDAKDELISSQNNILDELISWANGNGLPTYLAERLVNANHFGNIDMHIPRRLMRDYMERHVGKTYYTPTAIRILKRVLLSPNDYTRKGVEVIESGSVKTIWDLTFVVPDLQTLRDRLEVEFGRKINWMDPVPSADDIPQNVIELAKREVPF